MNAGTRLNVLLLCAFAGLLLLLLARVTGLQQQNAALSRKLAAVTEENVELRSNAVPPTPPRAETSLELLRLRNEVSMLRKKTNLLVEQSVQRPKEDSDTTQPAAAPIPAESWAYAGYATPEASLQTVAWAMRTGNVEQFLASFAPEERAAAAERFKDKSAVEIQRMLIVEIAEARALRPDKKMILEDGMVGFPISSKTFDDGLTVTKAEKVLRFKNVGGEWKFAD